MRNSVHIVRYGSVCNVLCLWRIWLIPTYRVYRLYDSLDSSFVDFEKLNAVLGTRAASEPPVLVDRIVPDTIVDVHGE